MTKFAMALALAGGLAALTGCQNSGNHHVEADSRPMRTEYTHAYTATQDTPWRNSTTSGSDSGTVNRGTTVYFEDNADRSRDWQQARFNDGSVRYVHPNDFRPAEGSASIRD